MIKLIFIGAGGHANSCLDVVNSEKKYTRDRGKALIIAHNIQKKMNCEYGVIEIDI